MGARHRHRRRSAVVSRYYADLGFGYPIADGLRVGFKDAALRGFARAPRIGDRVRVDIDEGGVAASVTLLMGDTAKPA